MSKDIRTVLEKYREDWMDAMSALSEEKVTKEFLKALSTIVLAEKRYGKGGHGTCCTCASCHFPHDDCECTRNDAIDHISHLILGEKGS